MKDVFGYTLNRLNTIAYISRRTKSVLSCGIKNLDTHQRKIQC